MVSQHIMTVPLFNIAHGRVLCWLDCKLSRRPAENHRFLSSLAQILFFSLEYCLSQNSASYLAFKKKQQQQQHKSIWLLLCVHVLLKYCRKITSIPAAVRELSRSSIWALLDTHPKVVQILGEVTGIKDTCWVVTKTRDCRQLALHIMTIYPPTLFLLTTTREKIERSQCVWLLRCYWRYGAVKDSTEGTS